MKKTANVERIKVAMNNNWVDPQSIFLSINTFIDQTDKNWLVTEFDLQDVTAPGKVAWSPRWKKINYKENENKTRKGGR